MCHYHFRGLAEWSGTWKEHDWKNGNKLGKRGVWIDLSEWAKEGEGEGEKKRVSNVNSHKRVTSTEEDFNHQVDRMIRSLDTLSLFAQTPLSLTNGLMNKVAMYEGYT